MEKNWSQYEYQLTFLLGTSKHYTDVTNPATMTSLTPLLTNPATRTLLTPLLTNPATRTLLTSFYLIWFHDVTKQSTMS